MTLGRVNTTRDGLAFTQLCMNEAMDFSQFAALQKDVGGMRQVTALFQNSFRSCIPMLDQVTSFRFQSDAGKISFCLDNISLLPSTLQPAGEHVALATVLNINRWYDTSVMKLFGDNGLVIIGAFQLMNGRCNGHMISEATLALDSLSLVLRQ